MKSTKKIPRSEIFGHQKDCARSPNDDRMVAAGTSKSTPYCIKLVTGAKQKGENTYLVINKLQIPELVHRQRFESGMEERDSVQPLQEFGDRVAVH